MTQITDLTLYDHTKTYNSSTGIVDETFVFVFTTPSDLDSANVSGYKLFQTENNVYNPYEVVYQNKHSNLTTSGGYTYISYTNSDSTDFGKNSYFKVKKVDFDTNESSDSNVIEVESFCTTVTSISSVYEPDRITVTWDAITNTSTGQTSTGVNNIFQDYTLVRAELEGHTKSTPDTIVSEVTPTENQLTVTLDQARTGLFRIEYDSWVWEKAVFDSSSFTITNSDLTSFSSTELKYEDVAPTLVYVFHSNNFVTIADTTDTEAIDTSFSATGKRYIYAVVTNGITLSNTSFISYAIVHAVAPLETKPFLLKFDIQDSTLLNGTYWRRLKDAIVDKNYYNKDYYAIPYTENDFTISGYAYLAYSSVDIYLNGRFDRTLTTTSTGFFNLTYTPLKGKNTLHFRLRIDNQVSSTTKITLYTYNIYTHFHVMGQELDTLDEEIENVDDDFFIDTVRNSLIYDNFGSLVGLKKQSVESYSQYRSLVKALTNAQLSYGYRSAIYDICDAFSDYSDKYEVYEHDSHLNTYKPDININTSSGYLPRANYYYGITAETSTGGQTSYTEINFDKRWWPINTSSGVIALTWDKVADASYYNIYRKKEGEDYQFLIKTSYNIFCDTGIIESQAIEPPTYNFTRINTPTSLKEIDTDMMLDTYFMLSSKTGVTIMFYTDVSPFPTYVINRMYKYLRIACNLLRLRLIICHDDYLITKDYSGQVNYGD